MGRGLDHRRIPEPPGEAGRLAGDGSASSEQSRLVTLRPKI
jgi:hypothetical protein